MPSVFFNYEIILLLVYFYVEAYEIRQNLGGYNLERRLLNICPDRYQSLFWCRRSMCTGMAQGPPPLSLSSPPPFFVPRLQQFIMFAPSWWYVNTSYQSQLLFAFISDSEWNCINRQFISQDDSENKLQEWTGYAKMPSTYNCRRENSSEW